MLNPSPPWMRRMAVGARQLALALLLVLLAPASGLAGKAERSLPEIEKTGITAFDSVFHEVRDIHRTLATEEARLRKAKEDIRIALAVAPDTPIEDAVAELKHMAADAVKLEVQNGKPRLSLSSSGDVPVQARRGVDALNSAVTSVGIATTNLSQLPAQMQELIAAAQGFPAQLNPQLLQEAGMQPLQLPKVAKTVAVNVKATVQTPTRIARTVDSGAELLVSIQEGFKREGGAQTRKTRGGVSIASLDVPLAYAWADIADAEIEAAARRLDTLDAALLEEDGLIPTADLVEMHQLQALVALVQGDADRARQHVATAVAIDRKDRPGSDFGLQIETWHDELSKQARKESVELVWMVEEQAYVDGKELKAGKAERLVPGQHLLQVDTDREEGWINARLEIEADTELDLDDL